jgi:CTP:molybdopterin cytidylyltransferase MocA
MSVAGLVLAAGSGTRFGGPKALAVTGDRTWLEIVIGTLLQGGCRPVVVVLGASAGAARAGIRMDRLTTERGTGASAVLWVVNQAWADGRAGSLQCGLGAIPPDATGVVVHAVDHPDVRPETVAALVAAHQGVDPGSQADHALPCGPTRGTGEPAHEAVFLPVYLGHRGHPVLLARSVWPEVLALAPDDSLRTVVHRDSARLRDVEVDDPGIHRNRNERESGDIAPAAQPRKGDR